ncbi:polyADP-ribose polymerase [Indivirus ILV1]|uniref:NAD(+) ADP-ribosyltransferase n=1 Tax=Indivirus ILV1 TaxID=1977633 RepID=A0A1V0SD70_9VIRU|nr:polyADP-ribose polymerase [Indivirus ILV1]
MTTKVAVKNLLIDEHCPVKGVLVEKDEKIYSCSLNQTDIKSNKNKFYIIQLIKTGQEYNMYVRYGRISDPGVTSLKKFSDEASAIRAFETQFKTKTGNLWSSDTFEKKSGKYFLSEVSYDDAIKDIKDIEIKTPPSKLDSKVQELISMLSDTNMMNDALVSLEIDTKKMPLGKLKDTQLKKAEKVLDDILKMLQDTKVKADPELLTDLSSEYYTYLPLACGRKKPPVIETSEMIDKYKDVIDELRKMVVAVNIKNNVKSGENPLDSIYDGIKTEIKSLDKNSAMYAELLKYIANTHGPTHGCKLEVLDIFEIEQEGVRKTYEEACKGIDNRTLLFHGTPMSCVLSIFKNKFYLDPRKVNNTIKISGKLLGYGVYFADSCSKSINYCRAYSTNNIGCLIVNEIALGNISTRNNPDYNINKSVLDKTNSHSIQGLGKWEPSSFTMVDGVKIPNGPLIEKNKGTYLKYNEFVVYDINQIFSRYLIIVKNNGNYNF